MTTVGLLTLDSNEANSSLDLVDSTVLILDTVNVTDYDKILNTINYLEDLNIYKCLWLLNNDIGNLEKVESLKRISEVSKKVYYYERVSS